MGQESLLNSFYTGPNNKERKFGTPLSLRHFILFGREKNNYTKNFKLALN